MALQRRPPSAAGGIAQPRLGLLLAALLLGACAGRPTVPPELSETALLPAIRFTIQLGAFSTPDRAVKFADLLNGKGLDAYYFIDGDRLYKVRFGSFDSKEAARAQAEDYRRRGIIDDFYIVRPGSDARRFGVQDALRADLVQTARRFIGTPYRWGGVTPRDGFDCSGLTMTVYRLNGMDLPRTAASQFRTGTPVTWDSLAPGDLVFFETAGRNRISHVGIYSGGGEFIHAPGSGKTIRSAMLAGSYFRSRFRGARRYF